LNQLKVQIQIELDPPPNTVVGAHPSGAPPSPVLAAASPAPCTGPCPLLSGWCRSSTACSHRPGPSPAPSRQVAPHCDQAPSHPHTPCLLFPSQAPPHLPDQRSPPSSTTSHRRRRPEPYVSPRLRAHADTHPLPHRATDVRFRREDPTQLLLEPPHAHCPASAVGRPCHADEPPPPPLPFLSLSQQCLRLSAAPVMANPCSSASAKKKKKLWFSVL
jgi:hypothetical protein